MLRCPHGTLRCPHGALRCPGDGGTHWRTSWCSRVVDEDLAGLQSPSGRRASASHTAHPSCRRLPSPRPRTQLRPRQTWPWAGCTQPCPRGTSRCWGLRAGPFSTCFHPPGPGLAQLPHGRRSTGGCGLARGGTGSHRCLVLGVPASPRQQGEEPGAGGAGGEGSPGTLVREGTAGVQEERNKADPFSNRHRFLAAASAGLPVGRERGFQTPFRCDFTQKRGREREADGGSVDSSTPPGTAALRGAPCPGGRPMPGATRARPPSRHGSAGG